MADPFVMQLLSLWQMEYLVETFAKETIDQEAFECLSDTLIALLIPSIGNRAKFLKKYEEYKLFNKTEKIDFVAPNSDDVTQEWKCLDVQPEIEVVMTSFNKGPGGDDLFHENASSMKEADADANRQLSGCETSSETNARKSTSSTKTISFPAPLPEFSAIMKKHMDAGSLLHHSNAFVQECGCFLLEIKPRPTSADYSNYSLTIVNRYQEFRDHSGKPEASMKKRLAAFVRNHRFYDKKKTKRAGTHACADFISTPTASSTVSPTKINAELKEKHAENKAHTKLLMKNSHTARRLWITRNATSVKEILEKFPHMKTYSLLMYEFELLKLQILPDQGFGKVIDNIGAVLKEAPSTDAEQMELLVNLEKALQGKRAASFPTAIAIQEAGGSVDITHGNPIYPVLRIFSKDESLSDAFLVVEGIVVTSIPGAITPYKCVKLLLAAYYVLDVSYPKQYLSFLSFLGEVILSADAKSSLTTYSKFMNRYRALPSQ